MTSDPLADLAGVILPPLRFAARDDFRNVSRLSGFASLAESAVKKARGRVDDALLEQILSAARGFDQADEAGRRGRVGRLLALLEEERPAPKSAARDPLAAPVRGLKGVGPKRAAELEERGLRSVGDVLATLPRTYEDRRAVRGISSLQAGTVAVVSGTVQASAPVGHGGRGRRYEVAIDDGTGVLRLVFFHFRAQEMQKRFARGAIVTAAGEVQSYGGRLQMVHPKTSAGERVDELGGVHPVYPEVAGLHPIELARCAQAALAHVEQVGLLDPLPAHVMQRGRVVGLLAAYQALHRPAEGIGEEELRALVERRSPGHRRLAFEELLVLALALALRRRSTHVDPAPALVADVDGELEQLFPFALTSAQRRAVREILADVAKPVPMARLLQGDVGAGKTAVAAAACLRAVRTKMQAAFMAPTEILAEQHARGLMKLFTPRGVRVSLLTGSLSAKRRRDEEARLRNRDIDVVVGTQALLSEGVEFSRLALCVIDEQHRFGVVQRAALRAKGPVVDGVQLTPHLLVMTATPIPRSLALTVYGDLSVSVLDELPPGRSPAATQSLVDADQAWRAVEEVVSRGERAFVVYPLIDASEKLDTAAATEGYEELRKRFGDERTALVHGRLETRERDAAMQRFTRGAAQVLVSTTVIEVGVDVPDATLMIVMNAERFGLAQLHQLRGRVGRSSRKSACLLVVGNSGGEDALKRLRVLEETHDGFRIADEDLALRGPGDLLGTRQSGMPSLAFSDLVRHAPLIELTREIADDIVARDPRLENPEHAGLRKLVLERYAARLALASS